MKRILQIKTDFFYVLLKIRFNLFDPLHPFCHPVAHVVCPRRRIEKRMKRILQIKTDFFYILFKNPFPSA